MGRYRGQAELAGPAELPSLCPGAWLVASWLLGPRVWLGAAWLLEIFSSTEDAVLKGRLSLLGRGLAEEVRVVAVDLWEVRLGVLAVGGDCLADDVIGMDPTNVVGGRLWATVETLLTGAS